MSPWEKLLQHPYSRSHFVQLYQADDLALTKNVGLYLREGLKRGDGVLVIATPDHSKLFCRQIDQLGDSSEMTLTSRQFVILDAHETLAKFMVRGQPDWERFEAVVSAAMRHVQQTSAHAGMRAYGEMVGILWKQRQFDAAIRLEQLWNRLLEQSSFSLYCAYAIDIFGKEFHVANLDGVLCTHSHLVPAQPNGNLESALKLSMDEILGENAEALKILIKANYRPSWAVMPNAEAIVLWLRNNLPGRAEEIVTRARHHYQLLQPADPLIAGREQ